MGVTTSSAPRASCFHSLVESPLRALDLVWSDVLYWPLDSVDRMNFSFRDSSGFLDLRLTASDSANVGPGKIGNSSQHIGTKHALTHYDYQLNLYQKSWTVRFWVNVESVLAGPIISMPDVFELRAISTGPSTGYWRATLFGKNNPGDIALSAHLAEGGEPGVGVWVRIILRYDHGSKTWSLQQDTAAEVSVAVPSTFATVDMFNRFGIAAGSITPGRGFYIDELGLWIAYLWTAGDATDDWNGGAGKTWPDVPNVD